jgi:DNA-binding Xre family transcriptional regulator
MSQMATVTLRVRELAESRGIRSAYQLKEALDIHSTNALRMWNGETDRITFEMIAKLCHFFKVKPGSLFTYTDD